MMTTTAKNAIPRFSVIVPVLNGREHLKRSLDSIVAAAESYGNAELIVADNGSTDGSFEILRRDYAAFHICQRTEVTVSGLRNYASKFATGDYLCFLDADCVIGPDYFHNAARVFSTIAPDATGARVVLPENPHWIEKSWYALHEKQADGAVNYINSGNFLIQRSVFVEAGGFDGTLISGADSEMGRRLNQLGFKIYEHRSLKCAHLGNEKDLGTFFRKHAWRGLGILGSSRNSGIPRMFLITVAHFVFLLGSAFFLCLPVGNIATRCIAVLVAINVIPLVSVFYRVKRLKHRGSVEWISGIFLYHIFYLARMKALLCIFTGQQKKADGSSRQSRAQASAATITNETLLERRTP